jgi:parallel beta-helix repeat protein
MGKGLFRLLVIAVFLLVVGWFLGSVRHGWCAGLVYIRADGSVEGTDRIVSSDNLTYMFVGDVEAQVMVERNDIVVDAQGFRVRYASVSLYGFALFGVRNVTLRNADIVNFTHGVYVYNSSFVVLEGNNMTGGSQYGVRIISMSHDNVVRGNNIVGNTLGVFVAVSWNNTVSGNRIANNEDGVRLYYASDNVVAWNNITANGALGVGCENASNSRVFENNIEFNGVGVEMAGNGSFVYRNNFVGNSVQARSLGVSLNVWDYEGLGNFWSDYRDTYLNASEADSSGVWDTPYVIDGDNSDGYPLVNRFVVPENSLLLCAALIVVSLSVVLAKSRRRAELAIRG